MDYTVLVVEDENDQRRALIETVRWADAGFTVVGEAENGVEALELVDTLEPDLILTDIMMPMIDGLQLAAQVRQLRPATQIVILSAYDRFDYAQKAINYNIIRYLLKPISAAELSEALFDIRRRMDERLGTAAPAEPPMTDTAVRGELRRLSVTEFLLPLILGSGERQPDDDELLRRAQQLAIVRPGDASSLRLCVLVSRTHGEHDARAGAEQAAFIASIMRRYMPCESLAVFGRAVTLVQVEGGTLSAALELPLREIVQSARRLRGERLTVGVSREFSALSGCADAYFQAIAARRYTADGNGDVRFFDDREHGDELQLDRVEHKVERLEQLLKTGTADEIGDYIADLYKNNTPENADLLIVQLVASVYRLVASVTDKSELLRLSSYSSEAGMREELLSLCLEAKNVIARTQRRETEVLCDRVVQIIDEQYGNGELSLTGVSAQLAVSPNYLSTLIKKTKGKNFITLLTERRMKAAYDMLVCTPMKILEVAERCGYSDQHYFSYCFKKFYGSSPNAVRAANRGEAK